MNDKKEQTEETNLIKLSDVTEPLPTDYMLTVHIQNLFATYGEDRVRHSMKTLFNMESKKQKAS